MSSNNIEWNDVIKKEARGINDEDLGVSATLIKRFLSERIIF
jgi:hypothetical protein